MSVENKGKALLDHLGNLPPFIIALSGGLDSTFLSAAASLSNAKKFKAVTVQTPYTIPREIEAARRFCSTFSIPHSILKLDFPEAVRNNPVNRCYLCKTTILSAITKFAKENGFENICDGSNPDDDKDYRPGKKAIEEFGVISPLAINGITKSDAMEIARFWNIDLPIRESNSCLMTRFPHGTAVTEDLLNKIREGEEFLQDLGLHSVRVRHQGDLVRLQFIVNEVSFSIILKERLTVVDFFKALGYKSVSMDLEGYTLGSFNVKEE